MATASSPRLRRSTARKDISYAEHGEVDHSSSRREDDMHDVGEYSSHHDQPAAVEAASIDGSASHVPLVELPSLPYPSEVMGQASIAHPDTHHDMCDEEPEDVGSSYTESHPSTPATRPCTPSLWKETTQSHPHGYPQSPCKQQPRKTSSKAYPGPSQDKRKRPKVPLEKIHICSDESCKKAFARKSDLQRHERIHRCEKPYACNLCGKRFIQTSALKVHERSHTGEKPFECEHCSKRFSDTSSLVRHRRVHTGERPYVCDIPGCPFAFCRKSSLIKHQMREHGFTTQVIITQTHRARNPPASAPKPLKIVYPAASLARRITLPKITHRLPPATYSYDGATYPMSANAGYPHPSMQMQMQMGMGIAMSAPMHTLPFSMQLQMQMNPHYPHSRGASLSIPPSSAQMNLQQQFQNGKVGAISPGMPPLSASADIYQVQHSLDVYSRGCNAGLPYYTIDGTHLHPHSHSHSHSHAQSAISFSQASSGYATPLESPAIDYTPHQDDRYQSGHPNTWQAPMADPAGLTRPNSAVPLPKSGHTTEQDHHGKQFTPIISMAPDRIVQPTFTAVDGGGEIPMLTVDSHTQSAASNSSISPTDVQPVQHTLSPSSPFGSKVPTTCPEMTRLHSPQRSKVEDFSPCVSVDTVVDIAKCGALALGSIPGIDDDASDLAITVGYATEPHSAASPMYSGYEFSRSHFQQYTGGITDGIAAGLTPMISRYSTSNSGYHHGINTGTDESFLSPATSISLAHSERRPSLNPSHYRMSASAQCGPSAIFNHNRYDDHHQHQQQQQTSCHQISAQEQRHQQETSLTPGRLHGIPISAPPHMTFNPTAYT